MSVLNPPAYLQAGTYPARYDRLLAASLLAPLQGTGALAIRSGVKPTPSGTGLQVTQRASPAMFVSIAAGTAYLQSQSSVGGAYILHNDASVDVAISAAHATLARKDIVVARIYDAEVSGALNQGTLEVVTGTPAGSPVAPATPAGAMLLATVQVAAAASSIVNANITDNRPFTVALGGTIPAPAASLPANPYTGMSCYDTTNLLPKWWNGTAWKGWQDEGYQTAAQVSSYVTGLSYITAAYLSSNGYKPETYVIKPSQTSRASNTTPSNDPHLTLAVAANAIYWVECYVIYEGTTTGDILLGWSTPAGTVSFDWISDLLDTAATTGVGAVSRSAQTTSSTPGGGGRGTGSPLIAPVRGLLQTGANSGNLTLQWSQNNSDAVATKVNANSLLLIRRLA